MSISRILLASTVLSMAGSLPAWSQTAPSVTSSEIADGIFMLAGDGGNIGVLIGDDGTFIIDDQYAPAAETILAEIEDLGGTSPRFVINTHFHGDHTGGNEHFGSAGATIVAHDNVRARLAEGYEISAFGMQVPPAPAPALPVITYADGVTVHLNGDVLRIVHMPGAHTDGDSVVMFEEANVIHAGDIFFNGFYPFIDTQHGGSLKGMVAAVDALLDLADNQTVIMPGHGPVADKAQLQAYRDMLATADKSLTALKAEGKSVEEAVAAAPLAEFEAQWGQAFLDGDQWITLIYDAIQ